MLLETSAGKCTVLSHLVTRDLPGWKMFDIPGCQQDARCDVVRSEWTWKVDLCLFRIPMMAMSMLISGLDDARRHQTDRQTNNQHARAIRIGGSYGVFLDPWHPRAQP